MRQGGGHCAKAIFHSRSKKQASHHCPLCRKGAICRIDTPRRGKPVAVLLSIQEYGRLSRKYTGFWSAVSEFRRKVEDEGIEISDRDFKGLRDLASFSTNAMDVAKGPAPPTSSTPLLNFPQNPFIPSGRFYLRLIDQATTVFADADL